MNAPAIEQSSWGRERWLLYVVLIFLIQLTLLWCLSDYTLVRPRQHPASTRVRLAVARQGGSPADILWAQADPTVFALVTPEGFSRSAWLTIPRRTYEMTNSLEEPHWLGPPTKTLADDFDEFLQTNLVSDELMSARIPPAFSQTRRPLPSIAASTTLRLEGDLAGRKLLSRLDLPRVSPEPILTNTVVRLVVDSGGMTLLAALISSCGEANADQEALTFARRARFAPLPEETPTERSSASGRLTFGGMVFQWFKVDWDSPGQATAKR
jgi:hypothetical protein